MGIHLQRIYDSDQEKEGKRVLVDRIWPRGVSKEDADLDEWLKEIAPSPDLRKWFDHDPDKFNDFAEKYKKELDNDEEKAEAFQKLNDYAENGNVILLYGAKDEKHNHAVILKNLLN